MKKLLALMLAAALALSLAACGGGDAPGGGNEGAANAREDMLAAASPDMFSTVANAFRENAASARSKYADKVIRVMGVVQEINEDHCVLAMGRLQRDGEYYILAYCPAEELQTMTKGEVVRVVGVIDDVETKEPGGFFDLGATYLIMSTAYYVDNLCLVGGRLSQESSGDLRGRYYITCAITDTPQKLYFEDGFVVTEEMESASRVQFQGVISCKGKNFEEYFEISAPTLTKTEN